METGTPGKQYQKSAEEGGLMNEHLDMGARAAAFL